jgi:hypothetical protein
MGELANLRSKLMAILEFRGELLFGRPSAKSRSSHSLYYLWYGHMSDKLSSGGTASRYLKMQKMQYNGKLENPGPSWAGPQPAGPAKLIFNL